MIEIMIEVVKKIYGRGKNRDEYGNPYLAAVIVTNRRRIFLPMMYTNHSDEEGVLTDVLYELVSRKIRVNERVVEYNYKHATKFSELEHPDRWRIEESFMQCVNIHDINKIQGQRWPANLHTWKIKRF